MTFALTSSAFQDSASIPKPHTCDGADRSPALAWSGLPAGTQSLVLIVDDPDAPGRTWVHWVLYDIPPALTGLPEGVSADPQPAGLGVNGVNDFKKSGYGGPCPPRGKPHRYFFKLYALDTLLNLKPGATKADLEAAIEGRLLAQAQLIGTYQR
jgi:hypothetical protein